MKVVKQAVLILVVVLVLAISWIGPMDAPATGQVDAGLKRALVSFATARTISAVLSVVQAAQVDIQPAGVGVTLSPGQLLAPVNELTKHFADLMLLACIAFGIQKVLISVSGYWLVSAAMTLVGLGWLGFALRRNHIPGWLTKFFVIALMMRFAIPIALLGTDLISQKFLEADYAISQKAIETATAEAGKTKELQPTQGGSNSLLGTLSNWLPSIAEIKDRYTKMKVAIEQSAEHMIRLMVVFLLQTLLLPLVIAWVLFGVARAAFDFRTSEVR